MKKVALVLFVMLFVFNQATFASVQKESVKSNFGWKAKAYSPELYLQPYFKFKAVAACGIYSVPFTEGFNSNSSSLNCWTTVDNNGDDLGFMNVWQTAGYGMYEGDQTYSFMGGPDNDDWLISPTIKFDATKVYRLKYYVQTNAMYPADYDVLLSTKGTKLTDFTKVLQTKKNANDGVWTAETLFISGVGGDVNIAWHLNAAGLTIVNLDFVVIDEVVNCPEPLSLSVKEIGVDKAKISWKDDLNATGWEYVVQQQGKGVPQGKGVATSTKENVVTQDNTANNLASNTVYEFYVRTVCADKSASIWSGPFVFSTICDALPLPFAEGFNTGSPTLNCWMVTDNNNDGFIAPFQDLGINFWNISPNDSYEGDQSMFFYAYDDTGVLQHDDYLISPTFDLDGGVYALRYYYKADNANNNKFEVLLSTAGTEVSKFTTTLLAPALYQNNNYKEEIIYINNITGPVNIAWHATTVGSTSLNIDKVTLMKMDCVDPTNIQATRIKSDEVTLSWMDQFNSEWEYVLQKSGTPMPVTGKVTTSKKLVLNTDVAGAPLVDNADYEFYVRARCKDGAVFSEWVGPFDFVTACKPSNLPFKEGFNTASEFLHCWRVIDVNNDKEAMYGGNIWDLKGKSPQEGDGNAAFLGNFNLKHDDYLISPALRFTGGIYAISYYYATGGDLTGESTFEVLLSKDGVDVNDFTQLVQPSQTYFTFAKYVKKTVYVQGVTGDVNIAWRVTTNSKLNSNLNIDNILIEAVDCIPPDDLVVSNVKDNAVDISWKDDVNTRWEYYVSNGGAPVGSGQLATTTKATITKDAAGNNLLPNTEYHFYIRSNCAVGKYSKWIGPLTITTQCKEYTLPFWEGFNSDSPTVDCWRKIDVAQDGHTWFMPPRNMNFWGTYIYDRYEGDKVATFYGTDAQHDDWYISPALKFEGKKYALTYYYKTGTTSALVGFPKEIKDSEFEILLSTKGIDMKSFTTVLQAKKVHREQEYVRKTIYIENVTGSVNIAWHATTKGETILFIDNITVEEVDCVPPTEELVLSNIKTNEVKATWANVPKGWEYVIQPAWGTLPTAAGTVVNTKDVTITNLSAGGNLQPNTEYEIYVRSTCDVGKKSLWLGPYRFRTLCNIFQVPFWEGFNSDYWKYKSESLPCWTFTDQNKDNVTWQINKYGPYEGDQEVRYVAHDRDNKVTHDDWLISPTIEMDGGTYILKYHYKADSFSSNDFEVLLSSSGVETNKFTTVVVPKKTYTNDKYIEEVAYIKGIKGNVNIAWHVVATGSVSLQLDNIFVVKASDCLEPSSIKVSKQTTDGFDVQWTQTGAVTDWEVVVVEKGQAVTSASAVVKLVSGNPNTTITGLKPAVYYEVYVRAICAKQNESTWVGPVRTSTRMEANKECAGAITVPVNDGLECTQIVSSSFLGAAMSAAPIPPCWTFTTLEGSDAWFAFTAKSKTQMISISDIYSDNTHITWPVELALYEVGCEQITAATVPLCASFQNGFNPYAVVNDLIVGQKYYMRLGIPKRNSDLAFSICITTPASGIEVIPSSTAQSVEQLTRNFLIQSNCDLISNITHQFGDDNLVNAMGGFKKNNSLMPFEQGIVLATHDVKNANGPRDLSGQDRTKVKSAVGDVQMNQILKEMGSNRAAAVKQTSILEFDYIPITDTLQFNYLFASDIYNSYCSYQCSEGGGLAAILVTDLTTGQTTNVALVPGTKSPVSTSTIRKAGNFAISCQSENPDYFWKNYYYDIDNPMEAAVNYIGLSVPMSTIPFETVPGRKYHIKVGVLDLCTDHGHGTAVFVDRSVFDLPTIEIEGGDRLIADNNALCAGEKHIIKSGLDKIEALGELKAQIQWYKNNVLISGATAADLEISAAGDYKVILKYQDLSCESSGTTKIEYYKPISEVIDAPLPLDICRKSLNAIQVDLTLVQEQMLSKVEQKAYDFTYFKTKEDAQQGIGAIDKPKEYQIEPKGVDLKLYILVKDQLSGCSEIFELTFKVVKGEEPTQKFENVEICGVYQFPDLELNQYYYEKAAGQGIHFQAGSNLDKPGVYTIYVLQNNGGGCYEEVSYKVTVLEAVVADVFEDQELECEVYVLKPLSNHNQYFTEAGGKGVELFSGMSISRDQTIYIYAAVQHGVCPSESSFKVTYKDCPIPKGISPNGDGINDKLDLSKHTVSSLKIYNRYGIEVYTAGDGYKDQWMGQDKAGKALPDGTYYYVIMANGKSRTGWIQINK